MLENDQLIMYGTVGLCRVMDVMTSSGTCTLQPVYQKNGQMIAHFDNQSVIRPVMEKDDLNGCVEDARNAKLNWYQNPDMRILEYKQAVWNCDFTEWLRLLKQIRYARQKGHKTVMMPGDVDAKYMKIFSRLSAEEYSQVFGITVDESVKILRKMVK